MSVKMKQLFSKINDLPQIPEVVRTLIIELNNPEFDVDLVIQNVSKDQVISMKVLRLVNSAHMGLRNKVGTIEAAVVLLGMKQLKTITIASGIVSAIPDIEGFDLKDFWMNNFRTASYAKWIADELDADPEMVFTVGLVSNIGLILMHMGASKDANEILRAIKNGAQRTDLEQQHFGFTTADLSAELCHKWKFPKALIEMVEQSAQPSKFEDISTEACIINAAKYISDCISNEQDLEEMILGFPADILDKLGLDKSQLAHLINSLIETNSGLDSLVAA